MSKNLTRKGLALAAIAALGVSVFAGAPAQAAGTASTGVTLQANAGSTYSTIAGTAFDLSNTLLTGALVAQYGSTTPANKLSYLITNAGAASLKLAVNGQAAVTGFSYDSADSAANNVAPVLNGTDGGAAISGKSIVATFGTGDTAYTTASASKNHLQITSAPDITANVSVDVVAFIDENGNGKIDSGDLVSGSQTVTFVPVANVSATTNVTSAVLGSNKLQATVVFADSNINQANLPAGSVYVAFKENGTSIAVATDSTSISGVDHAVVASWDTTDLVTRNAAPATFSAGVAARTYTAQAYTALGVKLGSAGTVVTPVAGTTTSVDSMDPLVETGSANVTTSGLVRAGYTGSVTFTSTVKNNAAAAAVKIAGNVVKVTISKGATFDAASTFVAGGVTLTATSGAVSFTTTTDADGKISVTGASSTGKSGDIVDVSVQALTATGYTTARTAEITYTVAAPTALVNTSLVGTSAVAKTTIGGTLNLSYTLADQFGQAIPTGTYRVSLGTTDTTTTYINRSYLVDGVAGKFTQAFVDNSTKAGNYVIGATVYKYDATATSWTVVSGLTGSANTTVYVNAIAASTVSATATATPSGTTVATDATAVAAVDQRVDTNSVSAPAYAGAYYTVSGTVADANGAPVSGAVVTITGAGLGFVTGSVYTVGSATVNTDYVGGYTVKVYSNVAGKTSVTVTSGAATKSAALEFTGVTTLDKKGTVTLDVVSLSQVGRAVTVSAVVKDSLGNPVKVAGLVYFTLTGVGSLSTSAAVDTDATGKATVQFLAGANDFGDAVITAKYTVTSAGVDTVVSASKTVTVGVTDAQIDIVGKRVTAVSSFTKGRTVAFYVDGVKKWSKLSASDADVVLYYNLKKGTHTVTVKITGGFVTTEKFIVQ